MVAQQKGFEQRRAQIGNILVRADALHDNRQQILGIAAAGENRAGQGVAQAGRDIFRFALRGQLAQQHPERR